MKLATSMLLFVHIFENVELYKILVLAPMPSKSHHILMSSLAKGLAEAGHDVTIVDANIDDYVMKNQTGSYTQIEISSLLDEDKGPDFNMFDFTDMNPLMGTLMMAMFSVSGATEIFEHPNVQKLLNSGHEFDVVILEQFVNDALKGIAAHFQAPLIVFSTVAPSIWTNPMVGNPSPPSYIPELWTTYSSQMTFSERTMNTIVRTIATLFDYMYTLPQHNKLMKKYLPHVPNLDDLYYNVSLILVNAHDSLNQAVPYVPNMIQIGGFHVHPPKKLPEDLQRYLDDAKDGAIYFSMGSNLQPSQMHADTKKAIIDGLAKFEKYKVLWKWDQDLDGLPPNFKLSKWFPQQEILAHPNVKLFITHGGQLSTTETVYHGVPILALPVFADQHTNAIRAEQNGYGLLLRYSEITEKTFTEKIDRLLNDPKYMQNVKRRSAYLRDRPVKPLDLAVYWTEFVARHRGAPHMRVAGTDMPFYKYFMLDVIAFLLFITLTTCSIIFIVLRRICCAKRSKKVKKQ